MQIKRHRWMIHGHSVGVIIKDVARRHSGTDHGLWGICACRYTVTVLLVPLFFPSRLAVLYGFSLGFLRVLLLTVLGVLYFISHQYFSVHVMGLAFVPGNVTMASNEP